MSAPLAQADGRVLLQTRWADFHAAGDARGWLGIFDFAWQLACEQTAAPQPVDNDERALAERDSEQLGIGFLVDGKYVHPDRVHVLGGVKQVDEMRKAAAEVRDTLAEVRRLQLVDQEAQAERATDAELVGARVRRLCTIAEVPVPENATDAEMFGYAFTLIGTCCYNIQKWKKAVLAGPGEKHREEAEMQKTLAKIKLNSELPLASSRVTMLPPTSCKRTVMDGLPCAVSCGDPTCRDGS